MSRDTINDILGFLWTLFLTAVVIISCLGIYHARAMNDIPRMIESSTIWLWGLLEMRIESIERKIK